MRRAPRPPRARALATAIAGAALLLPAVSPAAYGTSMSSVTDGTSGSSAADGTTVTPTASQQPVTETLTRVATATEPPSTACADEVAETGDFAPVRSIDLPEQADWSGREVPYRYDVSDQVGAFDRVGYCLELTGPDGPQWVWASMEATVKDAADLGLPTTQGQVTRQRVDTLTVRSNMSAAPVVTHGAGWLEMWPNRYRAAASLQVPKASSTLLDADDSPRAPLGYGSFQVHRIGPSGSAEAPGSPAPSGSPGTVLAVNAFTAPNRPLDVGIGAAPDDPATPDVEHPDWTFAGNAADYDTRRLTMYVREAVAELTETPRSRQLYPRPGDAENVRAPVSGRLLDPDVDTVELTIRQGSTVTRRDLRIDKQREFSTSVTLPVSLTSTDVELRAKGPFGERLIARAVDVVAGDVFAIHGQSNAVARRQRDSASSEADRSPWIRAFGSSNPAPQFALADRTWHYGVGDTNLNAGSIGQWGLRMSKRIVDTYRVPVAVVNVAHGGRPISFFQRDDDNPTNSTTNYGRMLRRLAAAGVTSRLDGLLWYQGEAERDDDATHVAGFTTLLKDLRDDLGEDLPVYVHQVRTSPCRDSVAVALRDAQRRMQDTLGVTVLSTNGIDGHDGCHFKYVDGYRDLGDHNFAVLARDLYDGSSDGVAPPNPARAVASPSDPRAIVLKLRNPADELRVDPGVAADFRVNGKAIVSDVAHLKGVGLLLTLTREAPHEAAIGYLGHLDAGPWITNRTGAGLLAFTEVRVLT